MTAPLRPAIYARVSSKEQLEGYSLDAQERALRAYAVAQGWAEPLLYVEPGRSAHAEKAAKRPVFLQLLADVEGGAVDVVLVHKLDRWARHAPTALTSLEKLHRAGAGFVSLGENMNFVGPWGKAMFGILSIFAELYSDNLSTEVKKGQMERAAQGFLPPSLPYGARLAPLGKSLEVDPEKAPHLARILDLAASVSRAVAASTLTAEGVPTRRNREHWHPVVIGQIVGAASWLLAQPPPWPDRYVAAASRRRAPSVRSDRRVRLLTGLMRCGTCGGSLAYAGTRRDGGRGVQCHRPPGISARCLPGAPRKAAAAFYERAALEWVAHLPDEASVLRAATRLAAREDPALAELGRLRLERERVKLQHRAGLIDDAEMVAEAALLADRERAIAPRSPDVFRHATNLAALRESLPGLEPEAGNAALGAILDHIAITGRSVEFVPLPDVAQILREAGRVVAAA